MVDIPEPIELLPKDGGKIIQAVKDTLLTNCGNYLPGDIFNHGQTRGVGNYKVRLDLMTFSYNPECDTVTILVDGAAMKKRKEKTSIFPVGEAYHIFCRHLSANRLNLNVFMTCSIDGMEDKVVINDASYIQPIQLEAVLGLADSISAKAGVIKPSLSKPGSNSPSDIIKNHRVSVDTQC